MECVKKDGTNKQQWCDCVKGWDLREGWCVNSTLNGIQKDEYVKCKKTEISDRLKKETADEFNIAVIFIQVSILLLGSFLLLVFVYFIVKKTFYLIKNVCKK